MKISLYSTEECEKISQNTSLRYVNKSIPGITREKKKGSFVYYSARKELITDKKELQRINALKIPPAYHDVWICPYHNGHIQATGRDDKNRLQYRYHPLWKEARKQQKFHMMLDFGRSLPFIRKHVEKVLRLRFTFEKKQIICAIIYLLDNFSMRIGNKIYARENQSCGISTLRKKHVSINTGKAILHFKGKNDKDWHIVLKNKKIIRILKKCLDIPGYELFKYLDKDNQSCVITSQELNYYLQQLTGHPFTAKDFRTWFACRETFWKIIHKKQTLKEIISEVASTLGHTPAICQKNYIHPDIIISLQNKRLEKWMLENAGKIKTLNPDQLFLYWLENYNGVNLL